MDPKQRFYVYIMVVAGHTNGTFQGIIKLRRGTAFYYGTFQLYNPHGLSTPAKPLEAAQTNPRFFTANRPRDTKKCGFLSATPGVELLPLVGCPLGTLRC